MACEHPQPRIDTDTQPTTPRQRHIPLVVQDALNEWTMPTPVPLPDIDDPWIAIPASSNQVFLTWARLKRVSTDGLSRKKQFADGLKMFTEDLSRTAWGQQEFPRLAELMAAKVDEQQHEHDVVGDARDVLTAYTTPIIRFTYSFCAAILITRPDGLRGDGNRKFRELTATSLVRIRETLGPGQADVLRSRGHARHTAGAIQAGMAGRTGLGANELADELADLAILLTTKGSLRAFSAIERLVHDIDSVGTPRIQGWSDELIEETATALWEWLEKYGPDLIPPGPGRDEITRNMRVRLEQLSFTTPSMLACSYGLERLVRSRAERDELDRLDPEDPEALDKAHRFIVNQVKEFKDNQKLSDSVAVLAYAPALEKAVIKAARTEYEEGAISDEELLHRFWGSYWGEHKRGHIARSRTLLTLDNPGVNKDDYINAKANRASTGMAASLFPDAPTGIDLGNWIYSDFQDGLVTLLDREDILTDVRHLLYEGEDVYGGEDADASTPDRKERANDFFALLANVEGSFEHTEAINATGSYDAAAQALLRTREFEQDVRNAYVHGVPDLAVCTEPGDAAALISTLLQKAFKAKGYLVDNQIAR